MSVTKWDRHAILAEIRRRGSTLAELSLQAGEPDCTASQALRQGYPKGEKIVADFLGIPVIELWPERYPNHTNSTHTNASNVSSTSQKNTSLSDMESAA